MNIRILCQTIATGVIAILGLSACAQTMKPGLWEANNKIGGSPENEQAMARMQQQMAALPPEQRKAMEDMLAKQGVGMGSTNANGMVLKMCITKQMAERNQLPVQQQGSCITTTSEKSRTGMKINFTCTNPPSRGEGQFTFAGDTAYTMKMKVNSTAQGAPKTTTIDTSAKWLAADCGTIKPMVMPK